MSLLKRTLSLLVAGLLVLTLALPVAAQKADVSPHVKAATPQRQHRGGEITDDSPLTAYNYFGKQLNVHERQLYNAMVQQVAGQQKRHSKKVILTQPLAVPENIASQSNLTTFYARSNFQKAMDAFRLDHPEVLWIDNGTAFTYTPKNTANGLVITDVTGYYAPLPLRKGDVAQTQRIVDNMVAQIDRTQPRAQQLLEAHNAVAKQLTYSRQNGQRAHQTMGLMDGIGVCESYAKSFKVMGDRLGIPTLIVPGTFVDPVTGEKELHMWNVVQLDKQWYLVDVTFDDAGNRPSTEFFLRGADMADSIYFPDAEMHRMEGVQYTALRYPKLAPTSYPRPTK